MTLRHDTAKSRSAASLDLGPRQRLLRLVVVAQRLGQLALDAVVRPDLVARDVVPDDADPRVAHGEVVVELGREPLERGQARPRDVAEVVVLVVVADVPREPVERAVVRVGLLLVVKVREYVVLRDEVAGAWVQPAREEDAKDHVEKW